MSRYTNKMNPGRKKRSIRKLLLIVLLSLIVALAVAAVVRINSSKSSEAEDRIEPINSAADSQTKGEPTNQNQNESTDIPPSQDGSWSSEEKNPRNSNSPDGTKPRQPEGNFVSNHKVALNESSLQSSCVTTPGATCQIIFTKDNITKSLDSKSADAGGGAYWSWSPHEAGLTPGIWKVKAKATIGTQSTISEDAVPLEVMP